ncbi:PCI domain-containing protein 2, partial [Pavlovales sp. CCMP2436]
QAEEQLMYAFTHCPRESLKNKRLCLMYLVPTRLVLGKLASAALLGKYSLHHYTALCAAVNQGDLRAFNEHKEAHQSLYIQQGVYLIVERARTICYRNLFRKLHALIGSNKLSLKQMASAVTAVGVEVDVDELECVLANLIYQNYVKGYISHQKRFLVVSAKEPFPALSSVAQTS